LSIGKLNGKLQNGLQALALLGLALAVASPAMATTHHRANKTKTKAHTAARHTSSKHSRHHARVKKAGAWKRHGQHEIGDERAAEIQQALIREGYLNGSPSGSWDSQTKTAMQRYQAANGWQTKRVPDSRAIIKLGLGPNRVVNNATEVATSSAAAPVVPTVADPNPATANTAAGMPQR